MTHQYVFDYHDGDIYWCTADVGWVTGHSYIVYGPLANGATTLMFEGVPNYPTTSRFWEVIDKHKVNIFYTAPTAIRALMQRGRRAGEEDLAQIACACSARSASRSIRKPGSGTTTWSATDRCPIVDTWWQTETGGILITPLPGATALKPGSATLPFFGVMPADRRCRRQGARRRRPAAISCIADSWPGQMRTVYGDHERFVADLFLDLYRQLFHRRRLPPRRGWLLLDHRPGRRRDQRRRPPHRHGRGRKRAGGASQGVGGRRGRLSARHQGPGHLRLCDVDGRRAADRGAAQGAGRSGCARRSARSPRPT